MPFKKNFNQKCGFSMIQENFVEKVAGFFFEQKAIIQIKRICTISKNCILELQ